MSGTILKGRCFCGAVAFEAKGPPSRMLDCFCTDCQHSLGGGPARLFGVDGRDFRITKGSLKSFTHPGGSGHAVERMFCGECGAPVAVRPAKTEELLFIIASALDDPSVFQPQMAIWVGSAKSWHCVPDGIPSYEKRRPV